jgi:tetratricopeptide (TPR) repeat protein
VADKASTRLSKVERTLDRSRERLDGLRDELARLEPALDEALLKAGASDEHRRARAALQGTSGAAEAVVRTLFELGDRAELLQAEWVAVRRWTADGLADLQGTLAQLSARKPNAAVQQWVHEMLDAVRVGNWDALRSLADLPLTLPDELTEGAETVRQKVGRWLKDDDGAGIELCNALTTGAIAGWTDVLDAQTLSRVHRVAAWLAFRRMNNWEAARDHLEKAVELDPDRGLSYGDRAAYLLALGDLTAAASDAQRAIELSPHDAVGYLYLGGWAELSGEFAEARELYLRGFDKMPTHLITLQPRRASLLDPPGGMLVAAGETLLGRRRPDAALALLDEALVIGVPGTDNYPDAVVHSLRSRALELDREPRDAAVAAVEAGKRYQWSNNFTQALAELQRALELDPRAEEAGWYLADTFIALTVDPEQERPRLEPLRKARETWDSWAKTVGLPRGPTSWAYLTRAIIAEKEWYTREHNRADARWEAVYFVEKALVHADGDSYRWGFATKYLDLGGLPMNALEAAERGVALGGTWETLLSGRVALLANAGRLEDAEQALQEFVSWHDESPWSRGVQGWLALHLARHDGLTEFDRNRLETAVKDFTFAIDGLYDVPWSLDMRALARLALPDVSGAHDDFRALLERGDPVDGWGKCRLAIAATALGARDHAGQWLAAAREDDDAAPSHLLLAESYAALAEGDLERGSAAFEEVLEASPNIRDLDDMVVQMLLRLRATGAGDDSPAAEVVRRVAEDAGVRRRAQLEAEPATADDELAARLAPFETTELAELPAAAVALLAVRGRRSLVAGQFEQAEAAYRRLAGSSFEPEATIALEQTLLSMRDASMAAGDADAVKSVHKRLAKLGKSDSVQQSFDVSAALLQAGRAGEAQAELEGVKERRLDRTRTLDLHRRRAEIALARGDGVESATHLRRALAVAEEIGDRPAVAQIELRLSLADFTAGERSGAARHLVAALRNWQQAGAFDPAWMMVEEFRGLTATHSPGWATAASAIRSVVSQLDDRELKQFTTTDTGTLERELELVGQEQAQEAQQQHGVRA